jgi:hypothetical protein
MPDASSFFCTRSCHLIFHPFLPSLFSVDKVDTEEMQQQAPNHKIRKRPLMRNAPKLLLVLRIRLHAQRGREHELADGCAEAAEEGVEWLFQ